MSEKLLTIILCTYNEEDSIAETIEKLNSHFSNLEIIVIDDNSTDNTIKIIKELNVQCVKLFIRKNSKGLSSAFMFGLLKSKGEIVGWIDTNMPYVIKKYKEMLNYLNDYDLVLLSRYILNGGDNRNFIRKNFSIVLNKFTKIILNSDINDLSSGLFLMKRNILIDALPICYGHGEFMIEFIYQLEKRNIKIKEIPYVQENEENNSKTSSNLIHFTKLCFSYFFRVLLCVVNKDR